MEFFTKKKQTLSFPFDDQQNTACIVCCRSNHNIEDASIVSLFEVYNIDYSICLLKDMPRGYYAIRENVESDWIVKK